MGKGNGKVSARQQRTRVPCLDGLKHPKEPEQRVGDLSEGKLLARADPWPSAKRDILPAEESPVSTSIQTPLSSKRDRAATYPIRRSSQRSGRNSSASSPKTSLFRCSAWTDHRTDVPLGTRMGCLPSLPPPRGRMVSLLVVLEFVDTGVKRRRAVGSVSRGMYLSRDGKGHTFFNHVVEVFHLL